MSEPPANVEFLHSILLSVTIPDMPRVDGFTWEQAAELSLVTDTVYPLVSSIPARIGHPQE
jgi:hypothetical protein